MWSKSGGTNDPSRNYNQEENDDDSGIDESESSDAKTGNRSNAAERVRNMERTVTDLGDAPVGGRKKYWFSKNNPTGRVVS
jgi:hypothetical protein